MGSPLRALDDGCARDALDISPQIDQGQVFGLVEECFDEVVLAETELEEKVAARPEPLGRARHEPLDQAEAICPTK